MLHVGMQAFAQACRQPDHVRFVRLGEIVDVAPVGRPGLGRHTLVEQLADQRVLAAAARPHEVEVVARVAHADAEMRRIYRAHLADALGQVFKFGSSRKSEPFNITWPIQFVRGKWSNWGKRRNRTHILILLFLVKMKYCGQPAPQARAERGQFPPDNYKAPGAGAAAPATAPDRLPRGCGYPQASQDR